MDESEKNDKELELLSRTYAAIPVAIAAVGFSFFVVYFVASLYNDVPRYAYHSFMLLCYYGTGLLIAPNRRPVYAAWMALLSIVPWGLRAFLPMRPDYVEGITDYGRNSDDELLFFIVGFDLAVIFLVSACSMLIDLVKRNRLRRLFRR